jgi:hypothetical protein
MSREQMGPRGGSEGASPRTGQARTERGAEQVSADGPLLDRMAIETAFRRLGDGLARRGVVADLTNPPGTANTLKRGSTRAHG